MNVIRLHFVRVLAVTSLFGLCLAHTPAAPVIAAPALPVMARPAPVQVNRVVAPQASTTIVQSTFADFSQGCAVLSNTQVVSGSLFGDGAVALAPSLFDDFTGTQLDLSKWTAYTYTLSGDLGGPYTPIVTGSVVSVGAPAPGAVVLSNHTYTYGTLEARAEFSTTVNMHIGFGTPAFVGNRYALFSSFTGDGNLYARVNNNATEANSNLGLMPTGFHTYRIEWVTDTLTTDSFRFYVDGVLSATLPIVNASATNWNVVLSNATSNVLKVDSARVEPPYKTVGDYASCVLDAGKTVHWSSLAYTATQPLSTTVGAQTRSGNTAVPDVSWSPWAPVSGTLIASPNNRYLQYQLALSTTAPFTTPAVSQVAITYVDDADVILAKAGPAAAVAGNPITYTVALTNTGPNDASGVTVSDTLPVGIAFDPARSSVECSAAGNLVTCALGTVAVSVTRQITVAGNISPALSPQTITNTAEALVSALSPDPVTSNNRSAVSTTISAAANLSITKSASPAPIVPGSSVTYTISAFNLGPSQAQGIVITDSVPASLTVQSATSNVGACTQVASLVECPIGALGPGATATVTVVAAVPTNLTGTLTNTAGVTTTTPDTSPGNDAVTLVTPLSPSADVSIVKSSASPAALINSTVVYTLAVNNAGPSLSQGVLVSDTLPPGVTFVSAGGSDWSCALVIGIVECTRPSLGAGVNSLIVITAGLPGTVGIITNTAAVTATTSDPATGNNASSYAISVLNTPPFGVQIAPATQSKTGRAGGVISYTLRVTNTGSIPDSFTITATSAWQVQVTPSSLGPLAAGEARDIVVRLTVPNGAQNGTSASATVTAQSAGSAAQKASASVTATVSNSVRVALPFVSK